MGSVSLHPCRPIVIYDDTHNNIPLPLQEGLGSVYVLGSKLIPHFVLLLHTDFTLTIKLSLSHPMNFLNFTLPILFPRPTGRE